MLRFQPPLVISYDQLDYALSTLEKAIQALNRGDLDQYEIEGQGW